MHKASIFVHAHIDYKIQNLKSINLRYNYKKKKVRLIAINRQLTRDNHAISRD